jgi:hypothetical protein
MGSYRFEIKASAGPARGSVLSRRAQLLVRIRLFDGPGVVDTLTREPAGSEEVFTGLRPAEAREFAFELLSLAEHAERITEQAGWWQR